MRIPFKIVLAFFLGSALLGHAATFGTVVPITGGVSDLVLDESRGRLYLVNSPQNRVEIYSISQKRLLTAIPAGNQPISAALSLDGKYLYTTSYGASTLDVIDLDSAAIANRISLPAAPEGVAVAGDGRVLITTAGTTTSTNNLLIYDPNAASTSVSPVSIAPPAPTSAQLAPTSGRVYISSRSHLETSRDGRFIIGMNNPSTTTRQVFVYESASGSVLRSRSVSSISSVLSVSPDGSRFMAGLTLFDSASLTVVAQQNAANSRHLFPNNVNFNTQQNQGGSVFAADGSALYTAFNVAPVQTPAAPADVSQLMLNDPDNMLIKLALQTPENLAGKMVISSDGGVVYAISQSGFLVLPVSAIYASPIADASATAVVLANDQCGVTAQIQTADVGIRNEGQGRMTVSATLQSSTTQNNVPGLGGPGGPGGGAPGGFLPPGIPVFFIGPAGDGGQPGGAPGATPGGGTPGGGTPGNNPGNTTTPSATSPQVTVVQTGSGPALRLSYNPKNITSLGTITPHDFAIQSPEAINIPPRIRVYQNNRNAEATGTIVPVAVGVSTTEGLVDMVSDASRNRLYVANSGLNRVEVFDTKAMQFLAPIKVGQLPHSLALSPDGGTLYVANTGGESISIIDPDKLQVVDKMSFPPIPFNASFAILTPRTIVATQNGLQAVMSDNTNNTLWQSVGNRMMPRGVSPVIGTNTSGQPATIPSPYSMAATPGGEYAILMDGNGYAYLYDAAADQFVIKQQIFAAPIQGYYGPIGAGPRGQYYLVNGTVLNASLTPVATAGGAPVPIVPGGGGPPGGNGDFFSIGPGDFPGIGPSSTVRPISAVTPISATSFARFVQPVRTSATAAVTTTPTLEIVNAATASLAGLPASVLEGPLATQSGSARVNIPGRTMAVDSDGTNAFFLTASGLTIAPISASPGGAPTPAPGTGQFGGPPGGTFGGNSPQVNQNGVVNIANYQPGLAPGSIASIFGTNLASEATADSTPLPNLLGGSCVTLNNQALPLILTSAKQINVQIPPNLAAGKYPLIVRSIDKHSTSASQTITVSKYAPAVMVDSSTGLASIHHKDGSLVTKDKPASRDEPLTIYASGLGPTTGGAVTPGMPSPSDKLAVTGKVSVYFGPKGYSQAPMAVNWSGLVPGQIGTYQINITVPGNHMKGDKLPVTISIGGVDSPTTGENVPYVAVN